MTAVERPKPVAAADTTSPEQPEQPRQATLLGWFLGFVLRVGLFLVIYALSIGPLYWQWYGARFAGGSPLLAAFYEPLFRLASWCPPLERWMDWYVSLWIT